MEKNGWSLREQRFAWRLAFPTLVISDMKDICLWLLDNNTLFMPIYACFSDRACICGSYIICKN